MKRIALVIHNIRSAQNVGSMLRTADGFGVSLVYLTGYTPFPAGGPHDSRLPHETARVHARINKTALGAEKSIRWRHESNIQTALATLQSDGYTIVALEQTLT